MSDVADPMGWFFLHLKAFGFALPRFLAAGSASRR